jgi:uncharacterized protein (TIGR03437 family)
MQWPRRVFGVSRREFLAAVAALPFPLRAAGDDGSPPAEQPVFFRTPSVHNLGLQGASILWAMPVQATASVRVRGPGGEARNFSATAEELPMGVTGLSRQVYQYRADLEGLTPGTLYAYEIRVDGTAAQPVSLGRPLRFRTVDPAVSTFEFLHFADSGDSGDAQYALMREMLREDPAFILANGDLAYDLATHADFEKHYFGVYRDLMAEIPFFATLGNHEYFTEAGRPALATRVSPTAAGVPVPDRGRYYSFDWGNAHFVALDSNWPLIEAAQGRNPMLDWLDADLRETRKFWRIAFFHHPGYSTGKHRNEIEAQLVRNLVVPILERYGVQLAFHGHEHMYQRTYELRGGKVVPPNSGGIVYLTAGGGGATPYWVEPNELVAESIGLNHYVRADVQGGKLTLHVRGIDQEGADLDTVTLAPPPILTGQVTGVGGAADVLATGGLAWINGRNLCPDDGSTCSVTFGETPARILSADANQIAVQIPMSFAGEGMVTVSTQNAAVKTKVTVRPVAPVMFAQVGRPTHVWALHSDGVSMVESTNPARPGEPVTITATGLGAVKDGVPLAAISVRLGGSLVLPVDWAAPVPDQPGVYQVQFTMPGPGTSFSRTLQLLANDVASNRLQIDF